MLVTEGLAAAIAFGLHQGKTHGYPGLGIKLGSSTAVEIPRTSATQKLGRFLILLKSMTAVRTTTISVGSILVPETVGKLHKTRCERGG